jgi:tetratricopeptide (TPR) repeat protein
MRIIFAALTLATATTVARADDESPILSPPHQKLGQGVSLVVEGRFREAEPVLREALRMDPRMSEAHYNLAVVLRNTGRYDEAIDHYRMALVRYAPNDEPNRAKALYGIALAAEATGDPERGARAWRDYIDFDRGFAAARPAVAIAESRLATQEHELALRRQRIPGTQKAGR